MIVLAMPPRLSCQPTRYPSLFDGMRSGISTGS